MSGLDGLTDYYCPLVASLLDDAVGLYLHVAPPRVLRWAIDLTGLDWPRCVVGCDVLELAPTGGGEPVLALAWADKDTLVGWGSAPSLVPGEPVRTFAGATAGCVALAVRDERFCVGFGPDTAAAEARAAAGLERDPGAVVRERKRFLITAPPAPSDDPVAAATYAKALAVLKANVYSPQGDLPCHWTTPDRWPHRHMWLWDSAFHAIALRWLSRTWGRMPRARCCSASTTTGSSRMSWAPTRSVALASPSRSCWPGPPGRCALAAASGTSWNGHTRG